LIAHPPTAAATRSRDARRAELMTTERARERVAKIQVDLQLLMSFLRPSGKSCTLAIVCVLGKKFFGIEACTGFVIKYIIEIRACGISMKNSRESNGIGINIITGSKKVKKIYFEQKNCRCYFHCIQVKKFQNTSNCNTFIV
jgi:hypothetical protein